MPSRLIGKEKSAVGGFQAKVASMFGMHGKAAGHRNKARSGRVETSTAHASSYASGTGQRIKGKGNSILGGITGNRSRQARGNAQNNAGHAKQNWNSHI